MAFRPNMTCFTEGISLCSPLQWRASHGMVCDLWHAEGRQGGRGHYVSPDPRVVVFLDDGADAIRLSDAPDFHVGRSSVRVMFIPAGMELWSQITRKREFRHLDLHFDAQALRQRLGAVSDTVDLTLPVLLKEPRRILTLARLMADEISQPARHDMMLDGLTQALLADLFAGPHQIVVPQDGQAAQGRLTMRQMRQLEVHMRSALDRRVPIGELAEVIGLSESWFAHAFKRTTGTTPHRWQMQMRIDRVRELLTEPGETLADVAGATGFADQAHLTRAFRSVTGTTPSVWRRSALT